MQRWLGAFPTPGPLPCSPDTIYEDCECSQELCSEPSTPSKTEGQSLDSKVPRKHPHKNPEGWLKGLPGAFPAQLVCEVTGEHERRKHLRQHQKLLEAVGPSSGTSDTPQP
ncbi:Rho guanine nucleotide exchange factor 15 [Cricetulus griseus]|nr:Rho guanine nucleotide exchange factor 15 [Cricetulus griseus]